MKAITLWQPWATLMAIDAKQFETRSWATAYRGLLAIHAAKGFPSKDDEYDARSLMLDEPFASVLAAAGYKSFDDLPKGAIVGVCRLVKCHRTEEIGPLLANDREHAFGNYAPKRFAWETTGMVRVHPPVHCRGAQQLWEPPADLVAALKKRIQHGRAV